jgi:naphthalene 1,2-dioxygenase ferredoxin reductase component
MADDSPSHPVRRISCRVALRSALCHDTVRIGLAIFDSCPFDFSPGQYASLAFGGLPGRDYSMASQPGATPVSFFIRQVADGASSAYAARHLAVGDPATLEGPYGDCWLRRRHPGPILALAGGSGLAPMMAIVEAALAAGLRQAIHLYFGVQDARDLYLEDHFRALAGRHANFRFVPVLSAPAGATAYRTGLLHEAVGADFAALDGFIAYLAGPPPMVEAARALLAERGIDRADIHADPFITEQEKQASARS